MAPNSSIVLHYRMYGLVRTCEVFGLQEPDVREALLDPEACQLAEDQIQEKALTFEDEADLSLRRFINATNRVYDDLDTSNPDAVQAAARCASTLDGIVLNRRMGRMLK